MEELRADKNTVIKAIRLVNEVLTDNDIPKLEGGLALRAIMNVLAEEGLDIRSEKNVDFKFESDH